MTTEDEAPPDSRDMGDWAEGEAYGRAEGAKEEREKIVEWIKKSNPIYNPTVKDLVHGITLGRHLR